MNEYEERSYSKFTIFRTLFMQNEMNTYYYLLLSWQLFFSIPFLSARFYRTLSLHVLFYRPRNQIMLTHTRLQIMAVYIYHCATERRGQTEMIPFWYLICD